MQPQSKDEVFLKPQPAADFKFGEKVASVFDDMLDRWVPFYQELVDERSVSFRSSACLEFMDFLGDGLARLCGCSLPQEERHAGK